MNNDDYKILYLKCQENFLLDVVRRCLEAEAKILILQNNVNDKIKELSESDSKIEQQTAQISQLLAGLEETTIQRNLIREEHARYRDEIIALGDLKEKCEKIEANYQDHMTNYNLVKGAYDKLAADYELLKTEHDKLLVTSIEKKNPAKTTKKDDWN